MQVRFTRLAALVIVLSATLVAGCGKYSISNIRSARAFQDANAMYSHNDWAGAQVRYEDSVRFNPDLGFAYFFLGHSHQQQEEAYVVVEGSGRAWLDGDIVDLRRWDVVRVGPPVVRAFEAGPDGMTIVAVGGPKPPEGDGVRAGDVWADEPVGGG